MPTVLFIVKATIPADKEAAFNKWYSEEHCPQALQFPGLVSARRYQAIDGEDKYQYMAMYEVQDEATARLVERKVLLPGGSPSQAGPRPAKRLTAENPAIPSGVGWSRARADDVRMTSQC